MKFNCKQDKLIQLIKKKGFNPVLTPRDNIKPLQLLIRNDKGLLAWFNDIIGDQKLTLTGDTLQDVMEADDVLETTTSELTSGISGTKSSKVELEAGVELALYFLKAKDNTASDADRKAALKTALESMKKVSFSIDGETFKTGVTWSAIESFLYGAKVNKELASFKEMILNNQVYIITHVLSSNAFSFNDENSSSASIEARLPEIKAMLEGDFKGAISLSESSGIKYKGDKQMVFGVQAVRLYAEEENGKISYKIKSKDNIVVRGEEEFQVEEQFELSEDDNFLVFE